MKQPSTSPSHGIVLFAHGSRDPLWAKPLQAIAHAVSQASSQSMVRCAYLELMTPNLEDVIAEMAAKGVDHIRIAPMFLGVGKHAREDLPELVRALQLTHPTIRFDLKPSIGEHPELIAAITKILLAS